MYVIYLPTMRPLLYILRWRFFFFFFRITRYFVRRAGTHGLFLVCLFGDIRSKGGRPSHVVSQGECVFLRWTVSSEK